MFVFTFFMSFTALLYYDVSISYFVILVLVFMSFIAAIVEAITPKGVDNLTVPFFIVIIYWVLLIM